MSGRDAELVELEIVRRRLEAVVRDLGIHVCNQCRSPEIRARRDSAVAILDREAAVVAVDHPLQLGLVAHGGRAILGAFRYDLADGDVVLMSDPHLGGSRCQDLLALTPIEVDHTIALCLCVRAAMPDMGGDVVGSVNPGAREVWAEGVPIPPVKLLRNGRVVRDVMTTLLLNSRFGEEVRENLAAVTAALDIGRQRLGELMRTHGARAVLGAASHAQDYAERQLRVGIGAWPDGSATARRALGGPVGREVQATVRIASADLTVDFEGSDPAAEAAANSTLACTEAHVAAAVVGLLDSPVTVNAGTLRAIRVHAPEGTVVHASFPRAVAGGPVHVGPSVVAATGAALSEIIGREYGELAVPGTLALVHATRDGLPRPPVDLARWAIAGCSASADRDGWGTPHLFSRAVAPSVEEWELETDMRIGRIEYVPDTAGPGRWRGAPALEVEVIVPDTRTWTLAVGPPDARAAVLYPPGVAAPESLAVAQPIGAGSAVIRFPGGAGIGDPRERDRKAVLADVRDGLLSATASRCDYGVDVLEEA